MISEFYPNDVRYPDTAIILSNGFTGSVEADFGRAAAEVAQQVGALVLAYDRAGTGNRTVFSRALRKELQPSRMVQRAAQMGYVLHNRLDSHGISNAISFGQSGAAPEAVALTRSETVPIIGLGLTEPVAVRNMSTARGMAIQALYDYRHERPARRALPKVAEPEMPKADSSDKEQPKYKEEPPRYKKVGRTLLEVYYYRGLWRSTFTLDTLKEIGVEMPDVAVYTVFAGTSLNGNQALLEDLTDKMSRFRHLTLNKPFRAEVWPDTLHSAFDKPDTASKVIERTLELSGITTS